MDSFDEIWELVKEQLKLSVTEVAYNVWLSPLSFVKFQNDTVYLSITEFKKRIIVDKFSEIINSAFEAVLGFPITIEYVVPNEHAKNPDIENSNKSDINERSLF